MLEEKHISELWIRMAAIYGHKWVSSYGPSDETGTWFAALQRFTPDALARGLNNCIQRSKDNRKTGDDDWPPSLGEFVAMCEPPRISREFPSLEVKPADPDTVRRMLAELRDQLANNNREFLREDRRKRWQREDERRALVEREPGSDDEQPEVAA